MSWCEPFKLRLATTGVRRFTASVKSSLFTVGIVLKVLIQTQVIFRLDPLLAQRSVLFCLHRAIHPLHQLSPPFEKFLHVTSVLTTL